MTVERCGLAMGCPSRVGNAGMGHEFSVHVDVLFIDQFSQRGDLANLLEEVDFVFTVAIDSHASRIISSIFQTLQPCNVSYLQGQDERYHQSEP